MNKCNVWFAPLFAIGIAGCSLAPIQMAGGWSDTEVSARVIVQGAVVDTLGTAVAGAAVRLRCIDSAGNAGFFRKDTLTEKDGSFRIASVKAGSYSIEVNYNDSLAVVIYCTITQSDSLRVLAVDTLRPMITVKGTVVMDSLQSVEVKIMGLDRSIRVDSEGQFSVRLPSGSPTLQFKYSGMSTPVEVRMPAVAPGDSQNIGVVAPPFSQGFPLPPACTDSLCEISALLHLLHETGLDSVPPDSVCRFENGSVIALTLRHRGITILPPEILAFPRLQTLDLSGNAFTFDPFRIIARCTTLTGLYLDSCALVYLPSTIGQLKSLKRIVLSDNELSMLPISIVNLSPDFVNLANNRILDMAGAAAEWADTFAPGWRAFQRTAGSALQSGQSPLRKSGRFPAAGGVIRR